MLKKILLLSLMASITGCGAGSGKGLDNQGLPITSSSSSSQSSSAAGVTLASLQQNIFGAICTNCHTGSNAPHGLRLDSEDNSYAFLVSHAADEVPSLLRVNPGNPNDSYIIRKLEGASGIVGGRMPLGGPYLSQAQINNVRDWIANGAPRTGTGTSPTKISNTLLQKTGDQLSASLHFSRALQSNSVTQNNIDVSYTTEASAQPIPVTHVGVLVLDQSIEILVNQSLPDAQTLTIDIHSTSDAPIMDAQQHNISETTYNNQMLDNNNGGSHHEFSLP